MRFDKQTRKITMECWPRNVDITDAAVRQYPGWPLTIDQTDNYGRKAVAYLPTIKCVNAENLVVQVVDESTGDWVYALRIKGKEFRPKVFKKGSYTVLVGDGGAWTTYKGVQAQGLDESGELLVEIKK
jgi:hypothetical protein